MMINAGVSAKELIDKGVCDKRSIWNPSNCECECDKSYDTGEYLDYENCKCRKKLVDKLVEKCTENVGEVKLTKISSAEDEIKHKCSSCTLYIVLFSIIFTANIGIGIYFVYYKYMNRDIETDAKEIFDHQATFNYQMYKTTADVKSISIKNRTYYFFNDMSNLNDFD